MRAPDMVHGSVVFIAIRQLMGRKGLNLLAAGGVLLGVTALLSITGIMGGFQEKFLTTILKTSPHVVIEGKELHRSGPMLARFLGDDMAATHVRGEGAADPGRIHRPDEMVRTLERMDGVVAASVVVVGNVGVSLGHQHVPVELRGIDPTRQDVVTPLRENMTEGSFDAFVSSKDGALVGSGLAKTLGAHVGQTLKCNAFGGGTVTVKVIGIVETGVWTVDKSRLLVPLRVAQNVLGRGDDIDRIEVRLRDEATADDVARQAQTLFGYEADSWRVVNATFLLLFKQQNTIAGLIVGALLAVGGFGILAVQVMTVFQKRRDIAILRSVGFGRLDIVFGFLLQGAIVSGIGALFGSGFGHVILSILRTTKTQGSIVRSDTFAIHESAGMYAWAVFFALAVGLCASAVPAWRASKVEPVDVLRGQV